MYPRVEGRWAFFPVLSSLPCFLPLSFQRVDVTSVAAIACSVRQILWRRRKHCYHLKVNVISLPLLFFPSLEGSIAVASRICYNKPFQGNAEAGFYCSTVQFPSPPPGERIEGKKFVLKLLLFSGCQRSYKIFWMSLGAFRPNDFYRNLYPSNFGLLRQVCR